MLAVEVPSTTTTTTTKPTPDSVVSNPIDRNVKIKVEEVSSSHNSSNSHSNSNNSSSHQQKSNHNNEPSKGNHSAQQSSSIARRKRIFSIDLDPAGFDFESSMAVTFATPSSPVWNGTDSGGDLPPIASLSSSNESSSHLPSDDSDEVVEVPTRDRIMSLDLSAFVKVKEEEDEEEITSSRPRGDSIIFDPMSFSDGGIHEEKALLRSSTSYFAENDEMELLNTPVYVNDATSTKNDNNHHPTTNNTNSHSTSIDPPNNPIQSSIIPDPTIHTENTNAADNSSSLRSTSNHTISIETNNPLTSISSSSIHTPTLTVVTASAGILTTETVLPSSAVTTLPTQIVPSSLHGTIPLTTCPMELLNKGGRIGIYLPAARKARIAKFHSKRKMRIWRKRIKYDCRKKLADSRPRIKGRFVKRSNMDDDDEIIAN